MTFQSWWVWEEERGGAPCATPRSSSLKTNNNVIPNARLTVASRAGSEAK